MDILNIFNSKMDFYEEIAYELSCIKENKVDGELVCKRADEQLPAYEAELMNALFTNFEDMVDTEWWNLTSEFKKINTDFIQMSYAGKSKEEYEAERMKAVDAILSEKNQVSAVKKVYELAAPLREAAKGAAYNKIAGNAAVTVNYVEVCSRLLKNGKLSLTEIVDCLPGLEIHDLYGAAEMLHIPVKVTEEELNRINEELEALNPKPVRVCDKLRECGMVDEKGNWISQN